MRYEIYIDVVFITNLLMDYLLLWFTGKIFQCRKSRRRRFLGAALGAFFSCLLLYIPPVSFLPAIILLHGSCAVGMLVVGCGLKKGSLLIKAVLTLYLAAFLCGGFWEAAGNGNLTVRAFVLFAVVTWLGFAAWSYLADSLRIRMKNVYPVTLVCRGRSKSFYGFYDSGNLLIDPVTRKPVSIGKSDILYDLLPGEMADQLKHLKENTGELQGIQIAGLHPHFVAYRSIGGQQGMLLAVTIEKLCIQTPAEVVQVNDPVIAFDLESSAFGKEYEVLLNSRLL